jgi:hypothetical protein
VETSNIPDGPELIRVKNARVTHSVSATFFNWATRPQQSRLSTAP